jgi:CheY-like chemotaxis protein
MNKMKLLIVDDEKDLCRILADRLNILYGISPDVAHTGAAALEMVRKGNYDVRGLDIEMPGIDGIETLKRIKEINPKIQGYFSPATAARRPGAWAKSWAPSATSTRSTACPSWPP